MPRRVILGPLEDHPLESESMRFRLYYDGGLKASQRDPIGGQADKLAEHKQAIRKTFHPQLRRLWETNAFLRDHRVHPHQSSWTHGHESPAAHTARASDARGDGMISLLDRTAMQHVENGYRFVPLVKKDWSLRCSLDILLLRRDPPHGVLHAGDIDNRLKTLIDGLRKPSGGTELRGNEAPGADEDPFFCLLEDDKLVTELSVETDTLLDVPSYEGEDDARQVRAIITVEIQPYDVTMFNLAFA